MSNIENPKQKKRGKVLFTAPLNYIQNLLYSAAIAEEIGYEVKIFSFKQENGLTAFNSIPDVLPSVPDFVVSLITFEKFRVQMELLAKLKQNFPQIKIIVTGQPFLTYNNNVTYENPFIDYVIVGEQEYTLRDILDGVPNNDILGICYTDDNMQSIKNEPRPYVENLDEFPFPARHLLNDNTTAVIEISRGCPYHCFFCISSVEQGSACRVRNVENIINEIKYCIDNYKTKSFYFKSCCINDNDILKKLCELIIEAKLNITWSCDIIPNNLDEQLAKLMYKSGCRLCKIGIESGSNEILSKIEKGITLAGIKNAVDTFKKCKIKIAGYFILGLPWETEETFAETISFVRKLNIDKVVFNTAVPIPGTKFFVYSMLNKLFSAPPEFSENDKKKPLAKSHKLSKDRIAQLRDFAEQQYNNSLSYRIKSFVIGLFKRH